MIRNILKIQQQQQKKKKSTKIHMKKDNQNQSPNVDFDK